MRRKEEERQTPPPEEPITVNNQLGTMVNPPAADAFIENLLRIVDEIEAEREAKTNAGALKKDSSDAA